ncbi:MAG: hypothetical protein Q9181_001352 [Wetmoreana brouardii]
MISSRGCGAFLVLTASIILLSAYDFYLRPKHVSSHSFSNPQTPFQETSSTEVIRSIALPFGDRYHSPNFSVLLLHSPLAKRQDAQQLYYDARCKGLRYYERVQERYRGTVPGGTNFEQKDIDDAWTQKREQGVPRDVWEPWFGAKLGRVPGRGESSSIILIQDLYFTNAKGPGQDKTAGEYHCYYIRSAAAIIAADINSPKVKLQDKGIPKAQIPDLVPRLHRFSDVAWTVWKLFLEGNKEEVTGPPDEYDENHTKDLKDPSRLRYIGHDFIGNEITDPVMRYIFEQEEAKAKAEGKRFSTEYPGLTFGLDTNNGLALLGTPNGVGTAWLLMDRFTQLGPRKLTVTIFTGIDEDDLYMIWHLDDP